jgi:enediyne biosynthesis protein CalE5
MTKTETEVRRTWRESACYWDKHASMIRTMFAPISDALIEASAIARDQSVLDVASGMGEPAHTIAGLVGDGGAVVCTDVVTEMVAAAKHQGALLGISNARYLSCSADQLPFGGCSFDAVVSRLGVMFFSDTVRSLREMLRVATQGGRIALAVWAASEYNPFFRLVSDVVARYIPPDPEDPDAPGAFRYSEPGRLAGKLELAGACGVREQVLNFEVSAPVALDEFWRIRLEISDTLREKADRLSQSELEAVAGDVRDAARGFFTGEGIRIPARVLIVSGEKC